MVDLVFFVFILFTGAVVCAWYIVNVERRSPGAAGLLALRAGAAATEAPRSAYVVREPRRIGQVAARPGQVEQFAGRYRPARAESAYRGLDRAAYVERGASWRERAARPLPEAVS